MQGEQKETIMSRRDLITEFIKEIKQNQERKKITETAIRIKKEGGFDANAFWKHDEMMKGRKKEPAVAIKNEKGEIEEDPEKIKEIYRNFYEKLLKDREPENADEKEVQELKEKCVYVMERSASTKKIAPVTEEEYNTMKK